MSTQAEAADQVVKIMLEGSEHAIKIAGAGAKQIAALLYAILRDQKRTKGKVRLANMLRSNKELRIFPVRQEDVKLFCKEAKEYGVLYSALRVKGATDGVVDIMARAEDASKINRIFERLGLAAVDVPALETELIRENEGSATDKEVPERVPAEHDPKEKFLDELFSPDPSKEQPHIENPTMLPGRSAQNPSGLSSRTSRSRRSESDRHAAASSKPSVRKELEALRQEADKEAKATTEPKKEKYPEHKNPGKKERRKHHEHQSR